MRAFAILVGWVPFALGCASAEANAPRRAWEPAEVSEPTVVAFVRHAEKARDTTDDPPLTELGRRRADCLATVLQPWDVDRLWATRYRRTRATLDPLSQAASVSVEVLPADDTAAWVEAVHAAGPGSRIVVAAHSNTIPAIVTALGGDPGPVDDRGHIPSDEYDRMLVLVVDGDETRVTLRQRYCTSD